MYSGISMSCRIIFIDNSNVKIKLLSWGYLCVNVMVILCFLYCVSVAVFLTFFSLIYSLISFYHVSF